MYTLLDAGRKIFTKIITDRLAKIITAHPILSELNWAALPGNSTQDPIHILNNIIEDAKEKKQQAWILSQDMSKAFDSVNIERLCLALKRIKIPTGIINILTSLFKDRQNAVITCHGLTEEYSVGDGIDQGDTISPLLWRIFYDPLISKINTKYKGYCISSTKTKDIRDPKQKLKTHISVSAFMDDTTWIAPNQNQLQQILNTATQFYNLNDIQVNPDKSQLLIINGKSTDFNTGVSMDNTIIPGCKKSTPVHILGSGMTVLVTKNTKSN